MSKAIQLNNNTYLDTQSIQDTNLSLNQQTLNQRIAELLLGAVAGIHNSIYRGKNLGSSVTTAQWQTINSGDFNDLYIGDYWNINNIKWRIAAFDYYLNTGDRVCNSHHVVIVPDSTLFAHAMNNTNITTGGYIGSKMYTEGLVQALATIETAFGASHILSHRQFLCNAVTNGYPSGGSWYDSKIELMTEQNIYGCEIYAPANDGTNIPAQATIDKSQYPLFAYELHINHQSFWLRNIVSATHFACVGSSGVAYADTASTIDGVRPAFSIYA